MQFLNLKNIWGVWIIRFNSSIYKSKQGLKDSLLSKVLAFQVWSWLQFTEHIWTRSWRDDLEAKSTGSSCSGPRFVWQHPHDSWQTLQLRFQELQWPLLTSVAPSIHMIHRHTRRAWWWYMLIIPELQKWKEQTVVACWPPSCCVTLFLRRHSTNV